MTKVTMLIILNTLKL